MVLPFLRGRRRVGAQNQNSDGKWLWVLVSEPEPGYIHGFGPRNQGRSPVPYINEKHSVRVEICHKKDFITFNERYRVRVEICHKKGFITLMKGVGLGWRFATKNDLTPYLSLM